VEDGGLQISHSSHGAIPILCVTGDIDMAGAPLLEAAVGNGSQTYNSPLLIDLTRCPFIDSGGLNVLFQAVRRMDGTAWLGAVGANANLRRLFETVGLTTLPRFRVLDDLSDVGG
jgi:anti-anti-sigma factor